MGQVKILRLVHSTALAEDKGVGTLAFWKVCKARVGQKLVQKRGWPARAPGVLGSEGHVATQPAAQKEGRMLKGGRTGRASWISKRLFVGFIFF